MKIHFDRTASGSTCPIDSKTVRRILREVVPRETLERIAKIRFGCNRTTTQEARIIGRGTTYEIRVNFCLTDSKSKLLSQKSDWVKTVENCGGVVDRESCEVSWSHGAAKRYLIFLLFHEIGHAVYAHEHGVEMLDSVAPSPTEEKWCDSYARAAVRRVDGTL